MARLFSLLLAPPTYGQTTVIDDPDANAVYAAVLRQHLANTEIRLLQETRPPIGHCLEPQRTQAEWQPALDDFRQANRRTHLLKPAAELGVLITPSRVTEIVAVAVREKRPAGGYVGPEGPELFGLPVPYVAVSAVGFNPDKTLALVYIEHRCDRVAVKTGTIVCNNGELALYEKLPAVGSGRAWAAVGSCEPSDQSFTQRAEIALCFSPSAWRYSAELPLPKL
jgi:hypothetical protein